MRNKLNILLACVTFLNATAQVTSHDLIFEKDQIELTLSQKDELNRLMSRLYDGEKLSIYPVTIDAGNYKYSYAKNAEAQAQAIANYTETAGFELLGMPRNFPSKHDGISVSVNLKYHKPQYLDAGEQPYSLQANYPEKESQFFLVDPLKDTTIYGIEGTIVHIPAHALTSKMKVEVELKEFYKMAELMINNLSTVSNGSMIETGGSIYLDAKEHNTQKNVTINAQIGLDVAFTNGKDDPEMEIFIKDPSSTKMNWIKPRREFKSTVTRKWSMTETLLDMEGNVISTKKYNSKKEWDDHLKEEADKKKAEEVIVAKKQENYERLKVYDLGYINCDKFPSEAKMQFAVTADDSLIAEYFIVFDDVKGVLKGENQGKTVQFGEVPTERRGTLVAVAFYGENAYFYKKSIVLKNAQSAKVSLQPVAKTYVDQQLAMLK